MGSSYSIFLANYLSIILLSPSPPPHRATEFKMKYYNNIIMQSYILISQKVTQMGEASVYFKAKNNLGHILKP